MAFHGVSEEVIHKHSHAHAERCPAPYKKPVELDCPHGILRTLVCGGCGDPVFCVLMKKDETCEHVAAAMSNMAIYPEMLSPPLIPSDTAHRQGAT